MPASLRRSRTTAAPGKIGRMANNVAVPTIELELHSLAQLFDVLDPAPFRERALDPHAHRYLLSYAQELDPRGALRLRVHLPPELRDAADTIGAAVHNHFAYERDQAARLLRARMRLAWRALLVGMLILASTTLVGQELRRLPLLDWLGEGVQILGWVMLWYPLDLLLFQRREAVAELRALDALAHAEVELIDRDGSRGAAG